MIKTYRVELAPNTPRQIVRESEPVSVRLSFAGLTTEVLVGGENITAENGFPLKNEDFAYRNWEFVVLPGGDKFSVFNPTVKPVTVNVLVMSLPAGLAAEVAPAPLAGMKDLFKKDKKEK